MADVKKIITNFFNNYCPYELEAGEVDYSLYNLECIYEDIQNTQPEETTLINQLKTIIDIMKELKIREV